MLNIPDYWPQPTGTQTLVNTFDSETVQTYSAAPGGAGVRLRETVKGKWNDDWFYSIDPYRGVLEYADDYPPTKWFHFGRVVHQPMVPGKEIIWGNRQQLGDIISGQCATAGIGGKWGWQRVEFIEILPTYICPAGEFKNVLKLRYWQTWGTGGPINGALHWFAPGIGQIKALWETNSVPSGYGMTLQSTSYQPAVS